MTKTFSSLFVLGAAGALSSGALAAVDTSQWKCETCPFEKAGTAVTVEAGVGAVSDDSARFGDFTGLQKKGAFAVLGGNARYRTDAGVYGDVEASDLGLDSRSLQAVVGREGVYRLKFGYSELPRHLYEGARTPFLGTGSGNLTLPFGPQPTTTAMPLASTLQGADIGYKRSRIDGGVSWNMASEWTTRLALRHDVRDGTDRMGGSFFSSASHLVVPVDQVTDTLEASASYVSGKLHATVAYQGSLFRNGTDSVTWANPFTPIVTGATQGRLALAPDNEFHQLLASGGYEITPQIRASAEVAAGRMTQDAAFLAATLNPNLAVGALPAASLRGQVDTFNANVRVSATPMPELKLNGTYLRDVRDNRTPVHSWPAVSTDVFLGTTPRINQAFSFTQDRFKLDAEVRAPWGIRASAGVDEDDRERTLQEVVKTRETTVWGRAAAPLVEGVSMSLKGAHADRRSSTYGVASWVQPPENPLLRKVNLAPRKRDSGNLRIDASVTENVAVGLFAEAAKDDYHDTTIGLQSGRSSQVGVDLSVAVTDFTQLNAFMQTERMRTRQAGSQVFAQPDWWADTRDHYDVLGFSLKHSAMKGRLELSGDLTFSRAKSDMVVDIQTLTPAFPSARTDIDTLRLNGSYRYNESITFVGGWWYERYHADNWRLDGVLPDTIANLLASGEQAPRYTVHVLRLGVRYKF